MRQGFVLNNEQLVGHPGVLESKVLVPPETRFISLLFVPCSVAGETCNIVTAWS